MNMSVPGVSKDYEAPCIHCGIDIEWNRCETSLLECLYCGKINRVEHDCCDLIDEDGHADSYCVEWLELPYATAIK